MKTVDVNGMVIGVGNPKICVPVFGKNEVEILEAAGAVPEEADLVEFRLDYYEDCMNLELVETVIDMLKKQIAKPLLVTLRTKTEGGEIDISNPVYCDYVLELLKLSGYELVDIELFQAGEKIDTLIESAHLHNKKVIMSNHDFKKTPRKEELMIRLLQMEHLGADIAKIAVMPESVEDLLTLLEVTNLVSKQYAHIPIVTMSMGAIGVLSRLTGKIFGSAMTFGMAGEASAPGQIDAKELHKFLELFGGYTTTGK